MKVFPICKSFAFFWMRIHQDVASPNCTEALFHASIPTMTHEYDGQGPKIGNGCFIAPSADLIGQVTLGDGVGIWYGAVVRADVNTITIGRQTNIQDNAVLHVTRDNPLTIGERCTIGHAAIVHAATIGDRCLIGMGAIILDGAIIGNDSLVAAGAVVTPNKRFPPRSLLVGSPATVVRTLSDDELMGMKENVDQYLLLATEASAVVDTKS